MSFTDYHEELGIDEIKIRDEINAIFQPGEKEFIIDSHERATWFSGRLEICYNRIQKADELAGKKLKKLDDLFAAERQKIIDEMDAFKTPWLNEAKSLFARFGVQMMHFIELTLKEGRGKRKSEKIGAFSFGYKKVPEGLKITDKTAALAWVKEHLEESATLKKALKIDESVLLTPLKDYFHELEDTVAEAIAEGVPEEEAKAIAEMPAFIKHTGGEDKFYIGIGKTEINLMLGINTAIEDGEPDEAADNEPG